MWPIGSLNCPLEPSIAHWNPYLAHQNPQLTHWSPYLAHWSPWLAHSSYLLANWSPWLAYWSQEFIHGHDVTEKKSFLKWTYITSNFNPFSADLSYYIKKIHTLKTPITINTQRRFHTLAFSCPKCKYQVCFGICFLEFSILDVEEPSSSNNLKVILKKKNFLINPLY